MSTDLTLRATVRELVATFESAERAEREAEARADEWTAHR